MIQRSYKLLSDLIWYLSFVRTSIQLIDPCNDLRESYLGLINEFIFAISTLVPFPMEYSYEDLDALLTKLQEQARGVGLSNGFVANSTYWLIRGNSEVVGVSNLRHSLTPALRRDGGNICYGFRPSLRKKGFGSELLGRTLSRTHNLALSKVLITCGKKNLGSVKVIFRNGGTLYSE